MNFNEYQRQTATTAIYPGSGDADSYAGLSYTALGLAGEGGEVAGKVKKIARDDAETIGLGHRAKIADELGDVLWYAAQLATQLGVTLQSVAEGNIAKLADRAERGVLQGSGDAR